MPAVQLTAVAKEYDGLWSTCVILPPTIPADLAHRLRNDLAVACSRAQVPATRARYEAVERMTGVPWFFLLAVHHMECGGQFDRHLHNGDPLTGRTIRVPAGRPKFGQPPFTWGDSAADAMRLKGLDEWDDWSVPGTLFQLERYNGFGYRSRKINTPYLWSGSSHFSRGKYIADGKFDPDAISKQIGAAVVLKWLEEHDLISFRARS